MREQLEYLKELKKEREEQKREAERKAQFAADLPKVSGFLESAAEEFPLLSSIEGSAEGILERVYEEMDRSGSQPDVGALCRDIESQIKQNTAQVLSNKRLVKQLTANPEIRAAVIEALGLSEQKTASPASSAKGDPKQRSGGESSPRTVATHTEIPTRTNPDQWGEGERREESLRLLRKWRETGSL